MKTFIPFLSLLAVLSIQSCRQLDGLHEEELKSYGEQSVKSMKTTDSLFARDRANSNFNTETNMQVVNDSVALRKKRYPPVKDGQDW